MRTLRLLLTVPFLAFFVFSTFAGQKPNEKPDNQLEARIGRQVSFLISQIKESPEGGRFLKEHSESDIVKVIWFLQYPRERFDAVKDITGLCDYIWAIQRYSFEKGRRGGQKIYLNDFFGFLHDNFLTADCQNVKILTYLLLNCDIAVLGEALADSYTRLFECQPALFVEDLKTRENWKDIVRLLGAGDTRAFGIGLSKLGSSPFELELKAWVAALEKKERFS